MGYNVLDWVPPSVREMTPYEPGRPVEEVAREQGLDPEKILKLASNENPLGASPKAVKAIREKAPEVFRYPDDGAVYLNRKLADRFNIRNDELIIGGGSNQLIELIGHSFLCEGRSAVMSKHAFVSYKLITNLFGAQPIEVPTKGLGHDLEAMVQAIQDDTSIVFLCNPNNPTGTIADPAEIEAFIDGIPEHILIVIDEAYAEIALGPLPESLRIVKEKSNCVLLRTFSKAYGLAGLRVGFGIGPKPLIEALRKSRQPFNVNRLAQEAALVALDDDAFLEKSRDLFERSKEYLESELEKAGINYEPTFTNFILVDVGDGKTFADEMNREGIIVRPMAGYGLSSYVRVNFGTMEENERFINTLKKIRSA